LFADLLLSSFQLRACCCYIFLVISNLAIATHNITTGGYDIDIHGCPNLSLCQESDKEVSRCESYGSLHYLVPGPPVPVWWSLLHMPNQPYSPPVVSI